MSNIGKTWTHKNYRTGNERIELSPYQKEVLDGELLGDGCIRTYNTPHAHCSARWRFKRKEHADLLASIFYNFNPKVHMYSNAWELQLSSNPIWDDIRKAWYPTGHKVVPLSLTISPTVAYHWYIGDGCLDIPNKLKTTIRVQISAMGFKHDGVVLLKEKLNQKGFCFTISQSLCLRTAKHAKEFLSWIMPKDGLLECYAYKWGNEIERTIFNRELLQAAK